MVYWENGVDLEKDEKSNDCYIDFFKRAVINSS
jgi:hypothetical protein